MSRIRACCGCFRLQAYAVPVCHSCGGTAFDACALPCPATVFSQTTVFRAPTPALAARAPYTVVLVRGAQGGLMLAPWEGAPPAIGDQVMLHEDSGTLLARPA